MTDKRNRASHTEAITHVARGEHAFIASDDSDILDRVVDDLRKALIDQPAQFIDASTVTSNKAFASRVASSCIDLLSSIESGASRTPQTIHGYLMETMLQFGEAGKIGWLVINHIDAVLDRQSTFEVEGAFRSVMQLHSDVAIVWLASNRAIRLINQSDRPFYLSFRNFWL